MKVEHHVWHTSRLGRDMGVRVYGHWGAPVLVFPTSGGDEWEFERQGMLDALGHHVDGGKVKLFCVNSVNNQSWYDKGAHPRHRSYVQSHVRRVRRGGGGALRPLALPVARDRASPRRAPPSAPTTRSTAC